MDDLEMVVLPSGSAQRSSVRRSEAATAATATVTTTTAVASAAATATAVARHFGETRVNGLLRVLQDGDEVTSLFGICQQVSGISSRKKTAILTLCCKEGDGGSLSPCTSRSANAVNIIFRVVGVIVVEDMSDIANILRYRLATRPMEVLRSIGDHMWSCERKCISLSLWLGTSSFGWPVSMSG
jgi:hypothetical protein